MKAVEELIAYMHSIPEEDKSDAFEVMVGSMAESFHSTIMGNLLPMADQAGMLSKDYDSTGTALHIINCVWLASINDIAERYKQDVDPKEFIQLAIQLLLFRVNQLWPEDDSC